jgi:uncharacterized protein YdaU (DUF1376 family)
MQAERSKAVLELKRISAKAIKDAADYEAICAYHRARISALEIEVDELQRERVAHQRCNADLGPLTAKLLEQQREIARLTAERDEARREVCGWAGQARNLDPNVIAMQRGWNVKVKHEPDARHDRPEEVVIVKVGRHKLREIKP